MQCLFLDEEAAHKTLIWTCNYIEFQAKQPPPSHSKDLHSIIIAAFSCISSWIVNHPWLMDDQVSSKHTHTHTHIHTHTHTHTRFNKGCSSTEEKWSWK